MLQGKYKEAQASYEVAAKVAPVAPFKTYLGWSYYHNAEYEKALDQLQRTYSESDVPVDLNIAYLSNTHYKLGNREQSDHYKNMLESSLAEGQINKHLPLATIYATRGEHEKALGFLEKSLSLREFTFAIATTLDPTFIPYHDDPRFIEMRKQTQFYK